MQINTLGKEQATTDFRKPHETVKQREHSPVPFLESGYDHDSRLYFISILIFDESHDANNADSVLNESLCNLGFDKAICVTATPESSLDKDWAIQLKIFGLVDGLEHSNSLFYQQAGRNNRTRATKASAETF
jgi:hypothetical protein